MHLRIILLHPRKTRYTQTMCSRSGRPTVTLWQLNMCLHGKLKGVRVHTVCITSFRVFVNQLNYMERRSNSGGRWESQFSCTNNNSKSALLSTRPDWLTELSRVKSLNCIWKMDGPFVGEDDPLLKRMRGRRGFKYFQLVFTKLVTENGLMTGIWWILSTLSHDS